MLTLQIEINPQEEPLEFRFNKEKVTIGRHSVNDIKLDEKSLSGCHAEFRCDSNGDIFIEDRNSCNGTFLNGKKIESRIRISKGDIINFGILPCLVESANVDPEVGPKEQSHHLQEHLAAKRTLSRKKVFCEKGDILDDSVDQSFCRDLIGRIELLDDLLDYYDNKWIFSKLTLQLNILKSSFVELLNKYSVDQFEIEPGTRLTIESRPKIHLIPVDEHDNSRLKRAAQKIKNDDSPTVLRTVRSGYVYRKGGQEVVIRKAEVVVT